MGQSVVEPGVDAGEIHLHTGEIVLDGGKPRNDLVELAIVIVEFRADRAKHVEHHIGPVVAHLASA